MEPVTAALCRIAHLRAGALQPSPDAVGRTLERYRDRDFLPLAEEYEHWLTDGTGQGRAPKDPLAGFRNQLRRAPAVARKTDPGESSAADPPVNGQKPHPADLHDQKWAQREEQWAREDAVA